MFEIECKRGKTDQECNSYQKEKTNAYYRD